MWTWREREDDVQELKQLLALKEAECARLKAANAALQRNFGVDGSNATDPSAEMLANMGEVVKAGLTSSFESPYERRQCLALSVILGMLMVEVVQLLVVLPVAWLIGAGLSARNLGNGTVSVAFFGDGATGQGIL